MSSLHPSGKAILELVLGGRRVPSLQEADRPYLLLEDLFDDPIELTLSDLAPLHGEPSRSGSTPRLH
jgi:hypothetical protein